MKFLFVVVLLILTNPFSSIGQSYDSVYSYEITGSLYSTAFMGSDYSVCASASFNPQTYQVVDSTNIDFKFGLLGAMSFKKYYNGQIYLDGHYARSDSFSVETFETLDPTTGLASGTKMKKILYPVKCGEWHIYVGDKVKEVIVFDACQK